MIISSGFILFVAGAVCCIACVILIPFACRRGKKKRETLLREIENEDVV